MVKLRNYFYREMLLMGYLCHLRNAHLTVSGIVCSAISNQSLFFCWN